MSARVGGTARRRAWVAAGAMLGAGSVVVVATTISAIETGGNPWERWNAFRDRMDIWWDVVLHGGISDDQIPFILLVVAVTWLASFAMAWSLFALRNAWLALIPLTLVIVFNSAYRELSFDWGVVVFLFAALVLIARAASERQRERWLADDTEYPEFIGLQSFWRSTWVAALLLLAAWMLPSNSGDQAFGGVWQNVGDTIDERVFDSGRFFAAVQGTRGDPFRDFGEVLPLGGSIDLRNRQQLRVELSESVPFLRLVAYEQYDGTGWLAGDRRRVSAPSAGVPAPGELAAVDAAERPPGLVVAEIEVRRPHRWLAVPGDPIGADRGFDAGVTPSAELRAAAAGRGRAARWRTAGTAGCAARAPAQLRTARPGQRRRLQRHARLAAAGLSAAGARTRPAAAHRRARHGHRRRARAGAAGRTRTRRSVPDRGAGGQRLTGGAAERGRQLSGGDYRPLPATARRPLARTWPNSPRR